MRRQGAAGAGVTEVIAASGVARRSLYLNFPGGKDELLREATTVAGRFISSLIRTDADPVTLLRSLVGMWRTVLVDSAYRAGCPIAAAALASDAAPSAPAAAGEVFAAWRHQLVTCFTAAGLPEDEAASLAYVTVSAVEGAVVVAVAEGSTAALDAVEEHFVSVAAARLGG